MKYSLHQFVKAHITIPPAIQPMYVALAGHTVDCHGYGEALVIVNSGPNGVDGTVEVRVQESDDGENWDEIEGTLFPQITEANDNTVYVGRIDLSQGKRKRYLRAMAAAYDADCSFGVNILLGNARDLPVSQVNPTAFSV